MASNNIERFTAGNSGVVWGYGLGEYVRYSDHERIVKELEARVEHLQDWQAGLMKTTVAWSEQGTNAVSLPDAISVVEGMRDEIRRDYTMREPCEEDKSILKIVTHQITALEMVLDRLRSLSPGETRKPDKTALEPKAAEIVEQVFRGYITHLSVRTAKQLAMETIGLILDERVSLSPGVATCTWRYDPDGYWQTECGDQFCFSEGGPTENRVKFCHYCGRGMVESAYANETTE
jgi:hypothetical protein